jgi:hypothetical protein
VPTAADGIRDSVLAMSCFGQVVSVGMLSYFLRKWVPKARSISCVVVRLVPSARVRLCMERSVRLFFHL